MNGERWEGRWQVCESCPHHEFSHYARPAWYGGPLPVGADGHTRDSQCGLCDCQQFVARADQGAVILLRQADLTRSARLDKTIVTIV